VRASLISACSIALISATAAAAPTQLRVSIVDDSTTTMGIAWTTDAEEATVVQYGLTVGYGDEASGPAPSLVEGIGYVHAVTLQGLAPATSYHYRVGDGVSWSDDAIFTTAGADPCQPWRFVAIGDNRSQFDTGDHPGVADGFSDILLEAVAHAPAFVLNSGDLVLDGHAAEQWNDYLSTTELVARSLPMLTAIGNHDDDSVDGDGAKYNGVFHLPRNAANDTEDFFVVRYHNAVIAVLSSATFMGGSAGDSRTFALQAEWLDQVLTAHADATWKIVAIHHPPFTGGGFDIFGIGVIGHEPNEAGTNEVLLPVLDRHHVDFVISGHNHWYERFLPLVQGAELDVGEVAPGPDDGTIYITTGGAGAYTMEFDWIPLLDVCRGDVDGTRAFCSGAHHYVVFAIRDRDLTMEAWSTRCQNIGCDHTPELIDSFSYTKAGVSTCPPPTDAGVADDAATVADAATTSDAASASDAATALDAGAGSDLAVGVDLASAPDSATGTDAPSAVDAGGETETPPVTEEGCGCGAGPTSGAGLGLLLLSLLGLLGYRRPSDRRPTTATHPRSGAAPC